ncbi:MAG: protein kinase [Ktedonobacteraceae bacterium]|nr:protein kinase [Ktedonobacteraceae bacterium]
MIGQRLGNYSVTQFLGKESSADVYLGKHIRLETLATIKVLHARLTGEEAMVRFRQQAQAVAQLNHPNIVRLLEFGIENAVPFLIMDYVPASALRQRHPRGQRLPLPLIADYVRQATAALRYAHEHGVVHGSVQPEYLLLSERGEVLLSNFAIATLAQSEQPGGSLPGPGAQTTYLAPEQLQGQSLPASDQYALAVVVYEWLSGHPPFEGTADVVAAAHKTAQPPSLSAELPGLPLAVEQVVMTALSKAIGNRFASIQAFARAFEQATGAAPLPASRPSGVVSPTPVLPVMPAPTPSAPTPFPPGAFPPPGSGPAFPPPQQQSQWASQPGIPGPGIPPGQPPGKPPAQKTQTWRIAILAALAVILIVSSVIAVTAYRNHVDQVNSDSTATAEVGHINATFAAQTTGTAQAQSQATGQVASAATATAAAKAQATASAVAANPYPPYFPGKGTLALYDPLRQQQDYWRVGANDTFGGLCQYTNNAYHIIQSKTQKTYICYPGDRHGNTPTFKDFAFEVQMTVVKGDCGGMEFRADSGGKAYLYVVCQDRTYGLWKYVDTSGQKASLFQTPSIDNSSIRAGLNQLNKIAVVVKGSNIKLFVNNQQIAEVQDPSYSTGALGLLAWSDRQPTDVVYSDAKIWTLR